jgi:formylglycine-generating enzyme required for sulfatase activity
MSRTQLVSQADLLRLLARQPAAPLTEAARLVGYQPVLPTLLPKEEAAYETAPATAQEQQGLVEPVFWHLARREPLHIRPSLKPAAGAQNLPAKLRHVQPLRAQELQFSVPDLLAEQARLTLRKRQSKQRALAQAVRSAARLRPLPSQPIQQSVKYQRLERLPPPVRALELLRQGGLLERSQCDWLERFFLRLARTWLDRPKNSELLDYINELLELLPDSLRRQQDGPAFLYGIAHRDELRAGATIPQPYLAEAIASMIQQPLPASEWLLVQEGEELFLLNSPDNGICLLHGSRIGALQLEADLLLLHQGGQTETAPVQEAKPICILKRAETVCLQSQSEQLVIQPCAKPAWAALIGRNSRDLFAEVLWLGRSCRLHWQIPAANSQGRWQSYGRPVDMDSFGLTACISFQGKVMQRFRWLEPGQFFMGSPEDEPEREIWGKETRHEVHLSKGFWLADTPVTQELWQFVMQNNPSKFRGKDHPVDSVSWEEVQIFLQRLNALLPGLNARLPFEAEWEYACRAGTSTAFAFGSRITPEQVNYNGQFPCSCATKGLFRRRTVPVRSLPANGWGLYEMHGNLWEWCQDWWLEDLGPEPALDPHGPEQGEFRVVRGGSWFLGGKGVRSAVRGKFGPADFGSDRVGFRIACAQESGSREEPIPAAKTDSKPKKTGGSLLKRLLRWRQ